MTEAEKEEKERIKREKIRKFESPIPFVIILRNLIFGKRKPDVYTRITFYIGVVLSFVFLIWNGITYFALISADWIWKNKGVNVQGIIERRAQELDFTAEDFIGRLEFASFTSVILWLVFFCGLVLLYRKKKLFIYFTLIPLALYIMISTLYLSFTYFMEDTTMFDKIALLILGLSLIFHSYLMTNERNGGSISFFGEDQEDD
jgi:hypothetical protein